MVQAFTWLADLFAYLWGGNWLGKGLAVLLTAVAVLVAGGICRFCYWAIDSWFVGQQQASGVICGKSFSPQHTITTFIQSRSVMVPVTNIVPSSWHVSVRSDDGEKTDTAVSEDFYAWAANGKKVIITRHAGRLSGKMYIDEIARDEGGERLRFSREDDNND